MKSISNKLASLLLIAGAWVGSAAHAVQDLPGGPAVNQLNLAPPVAGTVAVGAQQRADFGFGAGLTLMLTKSELETRVDLMFRLLSFEVGPHIKPLIPAKEKHDEPQDVAVSVKPQAAVPQLECPPGYQLAPAPAPACHPAGETPPVGCCP